MLVLHINVKKYAIIVDARDRQETKGQLYIFIIYVIISLNYFAKIENICMSICLFLFSVFVNYIHCTGISEYFSFESKR